MAGPLGIAFARNLTRPPGFDRVPKTLSEPPFQRADRRPLQPPPEVVPVKRLGVQRPKGRDVTLYPPELRRGRSFAPTPRRPWPALEWCFDGKSIEVFDAYDYLDDNPTDNGG